MAGVGDELALPPLCFIYSINCETATFNEERSTVGVEFGVWPLNGIPPPPPPPDNEWVWSTVLEIGTVRTLGPGSRVVLVLCDGTLG